MNITSRANAKLIGAPKYFTGQPCKAGHLAHRRTVNGSCDECVREQKRLTYQDRRADHVLYMKQYHATNREYLNAQSRAYYRAHSERLRSEQRKRYKSLCDWYRTYNKQYYEDHREYFERHNASYYKANIDYYVTYWAANAGTYNHHSAQRRSALKRAIPGWANLDQIHQLYQESSLLSRTTGIAHEVDHVIPLQSDIVCGLHVSENLQILTRTENRKKSNIVDGCS